MINRRGGSKSRSISDNFMPPFNALVMGFLTGLLRIAETKKGGAHCTPPF